MRPHRRAWIVGLATAAILSSPAMGRPAKFPDQPVDPTTRVDHDGQPIRKPETRDPSLYSNLFREAVVETFSRAFDIPDKIIWALGPLGVAKNPPAVNINDRDEVPNCEWFTNRNHVHALSAQEIRDGSFGDVNPTPPYTIKSVKTQGFNPGFNVKDAAGHRWVVKFDRPGFPRISSGAGVVTGRLIWAAGYNISHDEAFTFHRNELTIDPDLASGKEGPPFREADLAALLQRGARTDDGRYYASASLFIPGGIIGPFHFRGTRHDDPNDRFSHQRRRELRGLYVVYSWLNNWDVKDQQSLDAFQTAEGESLGYVRHHLLDVNASLGAAAEGPKPVRYGYEQKVDLGWTLRRFLTLGFAEEPWRRAHQDSGIPSVGNFEAEEFHPDEWRPSQYIEPWRKMTLADAYWGAKIVASFSNEQIAAAISAAEYDDPRAPAYLERILAERRDKIARYWFGRVAPLDFFSIQGGALEFHDLEVDLGLTRPRRYEIHADGASGPALTLVPEGTATRIALHRLGPLGARVRLTMHLEGSGAKPVRVDLERRGSDWTIARVRHG